MIIGGIVIGGNRDWDRTTTIIMMIAGDKIGVR